MSHVTCIRTGTQRGSLRFPDPATRPPISGWRCDLTALSRVYNLYFVAYLDKIHVYQPSFPDQRLPEESKLVFDPPVSVSGPNPPGIDPSNPHSITRLHVDYFGLEEIILTAHDDGDVVGYYVSAIQAALENPLERFNLHPFFHINVGNSAWGLAVHREARMIAASSNNATINVIVFELAGPMALEGSGRPYSRKEFHTTNNIPSVSFDNNDPSGRYLVSSDIDGNTLFWDTAALFQDKPVETLRIGYCHAIIETNSPPPTCRCSPFAHSMWGAFFVDPLSCHEVSSMPDAYGDRPGGTGTAIRDRTIPQISTSADPYPNEANSSGIEFEEPQTPTSGTLYHSSIRRLDDPRKPLYPNPIVLISKQDVFLIQSVDGMTQPAYTGMNILPTDIYYERLIYHKYVPELGILLLASGEGCVIYSLIRKILHPDLSSHKPAIALQYEKTLYNISGASFLPNSGRIVGLAVGPVQGMLDKPEERSGDDGDGERQTEPRRWRLMIHFEEHTIKSYELGLKRNDGAPTVADLVV